MSKPLPAFSVYCSSCVLSVFSVVNLLWFFLFGSVAWAGGDEVAAAEALLKAGKSAEAAEAFRKLADGPGGDAPEIQSGLGRSLYAAGDPTAALTPFASAAKSRGASEDHVAYAEALVGSARGRIAAGPQRSVDITPYLKDALLEVAAASAGKPTALTPERLEARLARAEGEAKLLLQDLPGARAALSNPVLAKDSFAQDLLARACWQSGDFAGAAAAFTAGGNARAAAAAWASAKDKQGTAAYLDLIAKAPGDVALVAEAFHAAHYAGDLAAFDEGLAKIEAPAEASWVILRARGRVAESRQKFSDAVAFYREVASRRPDEAASWGDLGRASSSAAPTDAAAQKESIDAFTKALRIDGQNQDARDGLGWIIGRDVGEVQRLWPDRSRLDRSLALLQVVAEADRTDAWAWANLGNQRRVASDGKGAIEAYDRALEANPYDSGIASDRGLALLSAGDEPGALAQFEKASGIDPGAISPRQNAGRLRWLRGEYEAAEGQFSAALKSSRTAGGKPLLFRFLIDRCWRSRTRPDAR